MIRDQSSEFYTADSAQWSPVCYVGTFSSICAAYSLVE